MASLSPPPIRSWPGMPVPWQQWFNRLWERVGGANTPDMSEDATVLGEFGDDASRMVAWEALDWPMPAPLSQPMDDPWAGIPDSPRDVDRGRWDDLRMIGSARLAGVNDPALSVFRGGLRAFAFANGATIKEIFLQAQLPHSYLEGSDLKLHLHWGHISGANNGAVVWQVEWAWTNPGDVVAAPTTSAAAPANVLVADQYRHMKQPLVTLAGAGKKISSVLTIRLFRDPAHASDTSTADAYLFEADAHFQMDHAGSRAELTKN